MNKKAFVIILFASMITWGCEETSTSISYQKEPVVNATLESGQIIDTLWLQWTGEIDKVYEPSSYAISNASVVVRGLDSDFYDSLAYDPQNPGRYYSVDPTKMIRPAETYSLSIAIPGWSQQVTAVTTVPDTFSIISSTLTDGDTVLYDTHAPVHQFYWSPSNDYGTYLPTVTYLDSFPALIPKFFYDTTSVDFERPPSIAYRAGLPKDQQNSDLPWVFLSYYGNIQFDVYAVDFNYSDYLNQSIPAQGGELKDIRFNVNGGIGIFGSRTRASGSFRIYLRP